MLKLSLKKKILSSIILASVFFGVVATVSVYQYTKNALLAEKKHDFALHLNEQAMRSEQMFKGYGSIIKAISTKEKIKDYLLNSKQPQREDILELLSMHNIGNVFASIYLMDTDGGVISSTDPVYIGRNLGYRTYFQKALAGEESVDLYTGAISSRIGYFFTFPIKDKDKVIGVISAKLVPEIIENTIGMSKEKEENAVIMLADTDGIVLYSNDEARKYKSLGAISEEKKSEIIKNERLAGVVTRVESLGMDAIQDKIDESKTGIFEYGGKGAGGVMVGIVKLSDLPFYIAVEHDISRFSGSSAGLAFRLGAVLALTVILMSCFIYWAISVFLRPIGELMGFSEKISRGKFDQTLELTTGDEFDDLIRDLNSMAKKLEEYYGFLSGMIDVKSVIIESKAKELDARNKDLAETRSRLHSLLKKYDSKN